MTETVSLKNTLISFVESVDLFNYLLRNHQRRVTVIAFNLGVSLNLSQEKMIDLIFAASLHDIGALTVIDRDHLIDIGTLYTRNHEIIGSAMLSVFPLFNKISQIIEHHHIRYFEFGNVYPRARIPAQCFILHLADRIELLVNAEIPILAQKDKIIATINTYEKTLFAPWCIRAFNNVAQNDSFWTDIDNRNFASVLDELDTRRLDVALDGNNLEKLAYTFARIADFRSSFTAAHSVGVAAVASALGKIMFLPPATCNKLKLAGLIHDIGKIAVAKEVFEKKGQLDEIELNHLRSHSYYTYAFLSKMKGFDDISKLASMHHEKLDGSGYPFQIHSDSFTLELEILAYADIFTSLCEDRPYRKGRRDDDVLRTLHSFTPDKLSIEIYQIIANNFQWLNAVRMKSEESTYHFYHAFVEEKIANY